MLAIKFQKRGKKHQKHLRIVVAEKKSKLNGKFIEEVGWVNPHEKNTIMNKEKVLRWIGVGAKPTASVHNLLIKKGIIKGKKIAVHAKSKKQEETKSAPVPQREKEETTEIVQETSNS